MFKLLSENQLLLLVHCLHKSHDLAKRFNSNINQREILWKHGFFTIYILKYFWHTILFVDTVVYDNFIFKVWKENHCQTWYFKKQLVLLAPLEYYLDFTKTHLSLQKSYTVFFQSKPFVFYFKQYGKSQD